MSTEKQIEANRLNAQNSTGPRSVAGKAVSSMNALKTGVDAESHIIPGEDSDKLDTLTRDYLEQFQPATAQERQCVDTLVRADWQLRRLAKADAAIWNYQLDMYAPDQAAPIGRAFRNAERSFGRVQQRIDSAERSYYRALHELERLQAARPQLPVPPEAAETTALSPQIGFVPQNPPAAAPDPPPPENNPPFPPLDRRRERPLHPVCPPTLLGLDRRV